MCVVEEYEKKCKLLNVSNQIEKILLSLLNKQWMMKKNGI